MGGVVMARLSITRGRARWAGAVAITGFLSFPGKALGVEADLGAEASAGSTGTGAGQAGAFLLAGKMGGIAPFNGLSPFVTGGIELGWIFGGTGQRIGALLDVSYTVPRADGSEQDARLSYDDVSGGYTWEITQKQLALQPTFLYRLTLPGPLVPFAGIGPRIYFLETRGRGEANGEAILESREQSTKFGVGLPLGVEYTLGPGGLMAQALLEWGPLDHRITGDSSLLGATFFIGYRARL